MAPVMAHVSATASRCRCAGFYRPTGGPFSGDHKRRSLAGGASLTCPVVGAHHTPFADDVPELGQSEK